MRFLDSVLHWTHKDLTMLTVDEDNIICLKTRSYFEKIGDRQEVRNKNHQRFLRLDA